MPLSTFLIWNIWKDDLNFKCLAARVSCRGWVDKEPRLIGPWSRQLEQLRWQVRVFKGGLYSVTPCCRHWQLLLWPLARCRQPRLHFIPRCCGFWVPFAGKIPQTCTHATSWIHFIATTCNYFLQPGADIVHQQTTGAVAQHQRMSNHWATNKQQKQDDTCCGGSFCANGDLQCDQCAARTNKPMARQEERGELEQSFKWKPLGGVHPLLNSQFSSIATSSTAAIIEPMF